MTEAQQKVIDELIRDNDWIREMVEDAGKEVEKPADQKKTQESVKPTYDTQKLTEQAKNHPLYRRGL
jgi:TRAP-type C4-dicarboxylate transport system substrate-binding protein